MDQMTYRDTMEDVEIALDIFSTYETKYGGVVSPSRLPLAQSARRGTTARKVSSMEEKKKKKMAARGLYILKKKDDFVVYRNMTINSRMKDNFALSTQFLAGDIKKTSPVNSERMSFYRLCGTRRCESLASVFVRFCLLTAYNK